MNVSIIGAGKVGTALAGSIAKAGHDVTITASSKGSAAEASAGRSGARVVGSNREAVEAGDVVVLAVPSAAVDDVLDEIADLLDDKVVVDVTNRVSREDPASVLDGTSNAERIQARVPAARVAKAFNTAFAVRQTDPLVDGTPADGYVACDEEDAKRTVLELVGSVGFHPVDAGPLVMSRVLEAMAMLIVWLQIQHGWSWQNAWKLIGPTD